MTLYEITVKDKNGKDISLAMYRGKVLLIVNTATGCGFTPQYAGLQHLYDTFKPRGFEILDFPCNQFANQAPGNAVEISSFCTIQYGTTFPQFAKIDVNGKNESPLFALLKKETHGFLSNTIKWNFTKFLLDKTGRIIKRYAPFETPESITHDIENVL